MSRSKRLSIESITTNCSKHDFLNKSFNEFVDIFIPVKEHVYAIDLSGRFNLWVQENYLQKNVHAPGKDLLATLFIVEPCVRFYFFPLVMCKGFENLLTSKLKTVLASRYAFCVSDFDDPLKNDFRNLVWTGVQYFLKKQHHISKSNH